MNVRALLNEGPGMFWRYQPGDRLVEGPTVALSSSAIAAAVAGLSAEQRDHAIADMVWPIGNKMEPDAIGNSWPPEVRSLSVGDVLIIGEAAYAVEPAGWSAPLDRFALDVSLSEFARQNPGLAEHRLNRMAGR